jgi:hypothetical protein
VGLNREGKRIVSSGERESESERESEKQRKREKERIYRLS